MAFMHTITNFVILYQIFVRHERLIEAHDNFYGRVIVLEFQIAIAVAIVFNFGAVLFLGHLICYHIMLQHKGMTTFEYIRWKEDRTTASRIKKQKTKEKKEQEKDHLLQRPADHGGLPSLESGFLPRPCVL